MDLDLTQIAGILETSQRTPEQKSLLSSQLLLLSDLRQYLFDLPETQRDTLLEALSLRRYAQNDFVFHKGDQSDLLYVVLEGTVGIYDCVGTHSTLLAQLGPGKVFGERGLVRKAPRLFTSKATTELALMCLGAGEFKTLLEPAFHTRTEEKLAFIDRYLPGAKQALMTSKERLAYVFSMQFCPRGRRLAHQGRPLDSLYFVKSGECTVSELRSFSHQTIVKLGPGSLFGDESVLLSRVCPYNIDVSAEGTWLYTVSKEDAARFIPEAVLENMRKQCILKVENRLSLVGTFPHPAQEREKAKNSESLLRMAHPAAMKNIEIAKRRSPSIQTPLNTDPQWQGLKDDLSHFTPQATGEVPRLSEGHTRSKKMRRTFE